MITVQPLYEVSEAAVEGLLDRAFGPDRHARTAYKIRGQARAIGALSFAALEDGVLVGTIQCWPVAFTSDDGTLVPLVMIGPVAVEPSKQRDGIGRLLMDRALVTAIDTAQDSAMMLIGDPEYYGRFFGFAADATGGWRLPGPVEPRRLLARGHAVPTVAGMLGAPVAATA